MSSVTERLVQLVEKQTKRKFDQLDASTTLEEMGIDSFDFIELLFLIEDEFGIEINDTSNELGSKLKTVGDVVAHIEKLSSPAAAKIDLTPQPNVL